MEQKVSFKQVKKIKGSGREGKTRLDKKEDRMIYTLMRKRREQNKQAGNQQDRQEVKLTKDSEENGLSK